MLDLKLSAFKIKIRLRWTDLEIQKKIAVLNQIFGQRFIIF